jgi:hypothetical protein
LIEKTYGRPAIGDIVGYFSMSDRPGETIMQVEIEGTIVEIPIDADRTGSILEKNSPGGRIEVWFYNCEWHIEGKNASSRNASPRIGISISELLKGYSVSSGEQYPEAQAVDISPVCEEDVYPEEDIQMAQDYINEIEIDFKVEAEALLKSIKLSHLQVSTS